MKIIFEEGLEIDVKELALIVRCLEEDNLKKLNLYGDGKFFWFFSENDECYIWDDKKLEFRIATSECESCGTYIIEGKICGDCTEEYG